MQKIKILSTSEKRTAIRDYIKIAPELSDRQIARALGVSPTTVGKYRREIIEKGLLFTQVGQLADWKDHPYIKEKPELLHSLTPRQLRAIRKEGVLDLMAEKNSVNPTYCQSILNKRRKDARKDPQIKITESDIRVFQHDIRYELFDSEGKSLVEPESIRLAICDPPYAKRYIDSTYESISRVAGRVLKPGGILLVMLGLSNFDLSLKYLLSDERLKLHWIICYNVNNTAPAAPLQWKKVNSRWKPILVITKGHYNGDIFNDILVAPPDDSDKSSHIWGQSSKAMETLIKTFTDGTGDDVVLDMMTGGGSVATACIRLNRKCISFDIDSQAVRVVKRRVGELFGCSLTP